jgi:hypothetical protein
MVSDPNLPLLEEAALKLTPFLEEIVFLGGVTLGLLITDQGAAPIRGTNDVDVIAEIMTYTEYIIFSERLRSQHFTEDMSEEPIACRWHNQELTLDVLPLDQSVLGYTNIWYESALKGADRLVLPGGLAIKVITAPFFLGTKMEAFRGRGKEDFLASHDLEDFVAVIDGRSAILEEIAKAPPDLRRYLADAARGLLDEPRFREVLPGYVLGDEASQQRVPLILRRLAEMAQIA